jgi:hypothetical protein
MKPTETSDLPLAELPPMAARKREILLREGRLHKKLLDKLEHAIENLDDASLSTANLARLLDFAIKLGRLNAGMATEHVEHEHAWSQYYDPAYIAEIDREIEKVFGKVVDVASEVAPGDKQLPTSEAGG